MILSCTICAKQSYQCPRCEGPVLVHHLIETIEGRSFGASAYICPNIECENYGQFKIQTIDSVEEYVCEECK